MLSILDAGDLNKVHTPVFVGLLVLFLTVATFASPATAGPAIKKSGPDLGLRSEDGHRSIKLGALLSVGADLQRDRIAAGQNRFAVMDARLSINGDLAENWNYFLQSNFILDIPLLDLRIGYAPVTAVEIQAGLLKVPVGTEFLDSAAVIDMVNRSQASGLTLGRQPGVQLLGEVADGQWFYRLGMFNGGDRFSSPDSRFVYAARTGTQINWQTKRRKIALTVGINGAYDDAQTGPTIQTWTAGGDVRLDADIVFLSFELLWAEVDTGLGKEYPWGMQSTFGYNMTDWLQGLLRWDGFEATPSVTGQDQIIIGFAATPPGDAPVYFATDVAIPVDDPDHHRWWLAVDVVF